MTPLARRRGGEPARRCRSDALLVIRTRSRPSIFSSARPPFTAGCDATEAAGVGRLSMRGAAAGVGAAGEMGEPGAEVEVKPTGGIADGFVFGAHPAGLASIRAA